MPYYWLLFVWAVATFYQEVDSKQRYVFNLHVHVDYAANYWQKRSIVLESLEVGRHPESYSLL